MSIHLTFTIYAYIAITIFGGGGLLYWMARNIRALKGTVGAQEKTIRAQSQIYSEIQGLLSTMRTVVESTDEPKMLERLKAYEQFVEKEKEAAMVLLGKRLGQQYELSVKNLSSYIDEFFGAILSLLPFIPSQKRRAAIDSIRFSPRNEETKAKLYEYAESAPDFSSSLLNPLANFLDFSAAIKG